MILSRVKAIAIRAVGEFDAGLLSVGLAAEVTLTRLAVIQPARKTASEALEKEVGDEPSKG